MGKAINALTEYNNNIADAWSVFLTSAQRQQYFNNKSSSKLFFQDSYAFRQ